MCTSGLCGGSERRSETLGHVSARDCDNHLSQSARSFFNLRPAAKRTLFTFHRDDVDEKSRRVNFDRFLYDLISGYDRATQEFCEMNSGIDRVVN